MNAELKKDIINALADLAKYLDAEDRTLPRGLVLSLIEKVNNA